MKFLFDFLPILAFFIAYKFFGIYVATGVAIACSLIQVCLYWLNYRQVSALQLVSLVIIVLFGSATLLLHNELIIKWKPSVLYWTLALIFGASQFIGRKPFIQHLLEGNLTLNKTRWLKLNVSWVVFFGLLGCLNLYVAYFYTTNTWVNFKLFGLLGLTVVFVMGQAIYLNKQLQQTEQP